MKKLDTRHGPVKVYTPEETDELFVPVRDRIFDMSEGGLYPKSKRIFRDDSWVKVIIRGAVGHSDRSGPPREPYRTVDQWEFGDRRDELQPLFDLLIEDGILDVIHMSPFSLVHLVDSSGAKTVKRQESAVTRPTGTAVRAWIYDLAPTMPIPERLLLDRTGRWGMYGSEEMFGLLGGEPEFMKRFIARSGGMEFIRMRADNYWQFVINGNDVEADIVPHYYNLAGWDNPPRKREG